MNRKDSLAAIEKLLDRAGDLHRQLVREEALKVMLAHPNLKTFCMGMGSADFTDFAGKSYGDGVECPKYMKPFFDVLDEHEYMLKTSGTPLRFDRATRGGPLTCRTDW